MSKENQGGNRLTEIHLGKRDVVNRIEHKHKKQIKHIFLKQSIIYLTLLTLSNFQQAFANSRMIGLIITPVENVFYWCRKWQGH